MFASDRAGLTYATYAQFTADLIQSFRNARNEAELNTIMVDICREIGFRYFALIHHDDLRGAPPNRVNIKDYPPAITDHIIDHCQFRSDPVIRGCLFAGGAFLWSDLPKILNFSASDRKCMERGTAEGLNEGITVPSIIVGQCAGSCTFAGMRQPERAEIFLGLAQVVGTFAFQAAKRVIGHVADPISSKRLHPRPRDCVVLAGRGLSNKSIARALNLTPRTVDGYLRNARALFGAKDRAELVVAAMLAGEIGFEEVSRDQPA